MPTYEYECRKCGCVLEEFQKISDPPLSECPKCSGTLARLPGRGAGIIFKGSGFYATDYRSQAYRQKEKDERGTAIGKDGKKEEKREGGKKKSGDEAGGEKKGA
ncbi:MAG: zinc ribbon domain-containing protein [Candidatus Eiseniibacteriota bacterium]|nr:MAG: zinc ribbon domain-containing protein [Candidatus Eisenbacteria bacterium]